MHINECDSTNNYVKTLLSKSEPIDGTVVITDKQCKGRGQIGNTWESEDYKNLTFSVVLKPHFLEISKQFYISKIISLACIDILNSYKKDSFFIKWPNDIYYKYDNDKFNKIGGILIENIISKNKIKYSTVGVGVNINQEKFNDLEFAISLKNILKKEIELKIVLKKILKKFDELYFELKGKSYSKIDTLYLEKLLGFNSERTFVLSKTNKEFKAIVKGVNELGQLHLLVKKENAWFNFKEIKYLF